MKNIPSTVVEDLIRLGGVEGIGTNEARELFSRLEPFDWVDRLNWQSWDAITTGLPENELRSLSCGLVWAEGIPRWSGGSVAGAIWAYKMYLRRFPTQADTLAEWMLAHSENPWVPFGSNRGCARSLAELKQHEKARNAKRLARSAEADLQKHLRKVREAVRRRIEYETHELQIAASTARKHLLQELRELSLRERIEHIAWDEVHPLSFYPTDLVVGTLEKICEADTVSLRRLIDKSALRRHGAWRHWLQRLGRLCAENRSFASAHNLEDLCEDKASEKKPRKPKNSEQLEMEE